MKKIGENIRFYRNLRGLTQTALARRVQVAPAYISQIEANQRVPSLKVTRRVAHVLGIDMSVLVRESDPHAHEGRMSPSEKLDLLRTLMMAIESERDAGAEAAEPARSFEGAGYVATELYSEPAFCVVLREFSEPTIFGRESGDADVECHVVLEGEVAVVNGEPTTSLGAGDCRSLSRSGEDRLSGGSGARVVSTYAPRVPLEALRPAPEAAAEPGVESSEGGGPQA